MPMSFRLKLIFIVSACLLFSLAVARYLTGFFIDEETLKLSFKKNLPFLIIAGLTLGILYIIFFKRAFPKGWQAQSGLGKVCIGIVILLLSFAVVWQGSVTLNLLLPASQKETIEGRIIAKSIETTRKGTKFYSLSVLELHSKEVRKFSVSKRIFNQYEEKDPVNKQIITGFMGIKYSPY